MKALLATIDPGRLKKTLLRTFLIGLAAHGFCYLNANFSHDSLTTLYLDDAVTQIAVGRFVRPLYVLLHGGTALPWFNGLLLLLYMGLGIYFLLEVLELKTRPVRLLATGLLVTGSSVTLLNAGYIQDADAYGLAFLLAVFGLWLWVCGRGRVRLWAVPLYILSLGLYQAFLQLAVTAVLIRGISGLLSGDDPAETGRQLLGRLLPQGLAMGLYYLIYRLLLLLLRIEPADTYNTAAQAAHFSPAGLLHNTLVSLGYLKDWFCAPRAFRVTAAAGVNGILFAAGLVLLLLLCRRNRLTPKALGLLAACLVLLPFGMSFTGILSGSFHDLMCCALPLAYLLVLLLAERLGLFDGRFGRGAGLAVLLLCGFLVADGAIYANQVYLKKQLDTQSTLSVYTRILDRLEQAEGYEPGVTPVAFVGDLNTSGSLRNHRDGFPYNGTGLATDYATTYYQTLERYFAVYLNYPLNLVSEEAQAAFAEDPQVQAMGAFPAQDCIARVGDVLVIKLS